MKFFIKDFLRIWSYLLKKSLMENFIFCAMSDAELQIKHYEKYHNFTWYSGMETLRKDTVSPKFPHQEIKWNYHIFPGEILIVCGWVQEIARNKYGTIPSPAVLWIVSFREKKYVEKYLKWKLSVKRRHMQMYVTKCYYYMV